MLLNQLNEFISKKLHPFVINKLTEVKDARKGYALCRYQNTILRVTLRKLIDVKTSIAEEFT